MGREDPGTWNPTSVQGGLLEDKASLVPHLHTHPRSGPAASPTHEASMLLFPASLPLQSRTKYRGKGGTLGDHGKAHASGSYTDKLSNTKGHGTLLTAQAAVLRRPPRSLCLLAPQSVPPAALQTAHLVRTQR